MSAPAQTQAQTTQTQAPTVHVEVVPRTPEQAPAQQVVHDKVMQEFTATVQEMLRIAGELALDLATTECPNASNCEICQKAKELAKLVKKLVKLAREHMRT